LMHQETQYDSVLVLNNDIILHPYNFVKVLRNTMFVDGYKVVSPSVLQPEESQCYWKQMLNWCSPTVRQVRSVDFMCPLIHRDVVEYIGQYSHILKYGWGQDLYTGVVCERNGWKTGVLDVTTVIHMTSQTYKDGRSDISPSEYANKATSGMYEFFESEGLMNELQSLKTYAETYTWRID
jgi:hypothetical protein